MSFYIEQWQIEYYMRRQDGIVECVTELFPCKAGYYQKFHEFMIETCRKHMQPISAVHGNYVQMCPVGVQEEGRPLPLEKRIDLAGAKLLVSQEHPITLTAPNGTKYVYHNEI